MNRQASSESGPSANAETESATDKKTATVEAHHVTPDAPKGVAFFEHSESWDARREHYRHVATLEVPIGEETSIEQILEQAWTRLQNGIDGPGSLRVESHVEERRSTSVGDVMVVSMSQPEQSDLDSFPYEVGTIGFREIADYNPDPSVGGGEPLPLGDLSPDEQR